jgi:hypothetical protein
VDCPTTPPFASILLFLHSVAIYITTPVKTKQNCMQFLADAEHRIRTKRKQWYATQAGWGALPIVVKTTDAPCSISGMRSAPYPQTTESTAWTARGIRSALSRSPHIKHMQDVWDIQHPNHNYTIRMQNMRDRVCALSTQEENDCRRHRQDGEHSPTSVKEHIHHVWRRR